MPYLNLDPNYFDHPKTRRLVASLGPGADVLPIRLWAYCARYHPKDGSLKGYTTQEIEGIIGWGAGGVGARGEAVATLKRIGFISGSERDLRCVDWHQHEGHLEAFSRRAKSAAEARWKKLAPSMPQALPDGDSSNTPAVPAVPAIPNQPNQHDNGMKSRVFVPPTLDEVRVYFAERKTKIDPEQFHAHYEANGWMIGRARVKSWKACLTTWEKNDYGSSGKSGGPRNGRVVGSAAPTPGKYDHLG